MKSTLPNSANAWMRSTNYELLSAAQGSTGSTKKQIKTHE